MNGHYIEVYGPSSESEVLEALARLLEPENTERTDHCPPLLTLRGGRTIVFVDVAADSGSPVMLAVGDLDNDDEARERAAAGICRVLASRTPWQLRCSADEGDVKDMRRAC